ncbi:hypothetical protein GF359_04375 [candidate division WOR-3 bacterium]|uniref:Lipoprotein n=1 Tax=candidate division WOR-3 bacterium TaxID=2052148 RepID=A0A9D5K8S8_UNCW3|nr:hypothetical protein [candidate division WOR-3 bacterium]MBD3364433.1 hypothetical protein [candidate division WOR-3 bacterium]
MNKKLMALIVGFAVLALATGFSGCEKEEPLAVGDLVWCQAYAGEGNDWETAEVIEIEGEQITVKWEDPFMNDAPEETRHKSEVVKKIALEAKKIKPGMEALIHAPNRSYPYKGEIVAVEGNDYIVEFKSGSADIVDTVDITSLWKFTR